MGGVIDMPPLSPRNHRNSPYATDRWLAQVHQSAAGAIWRCRTELSALLAGTTGIWELAKAVTFTWAVIIVTMLALAVMAVPPIRRLIIRRAWCVLSRHRIQRACFETRMHTRSGRLPLVLRITPTEVGERALIWCRAGICAADFEAHDVHLDQLRPPAVALDADLAGITSRGDLRGVRLEVGGADPGAAPDQRALPDLGRGDAQN